nr:Crp/Fnr family transcriptional regulator [uncultured Devosia sp.]
MGKAIDLLIRRLESIGQLRPEDREALQSLPYREASFSKGEVLVAEGLISSSACLVTQGYVHRSKLLPTGKRQIFSLHMAGDIPDLHSLHLRTMDHALVATSRCEVAFIQHAAIRPLLNASATLTDLLWRDTIIDSAAFRAWMLMIGQAEAPERMAHLFCELFTRARTMGLTDGQSFELPVSQADLADMLGTSTVHANRTLQDLRGQGLLQFEKGVVTILRWEALQDLAHFDPTYLHLHDRTLPPAM